jgi:phage terminase large subunit-like protein
MLASAEGVGVAPAIVNASVIRGIDYRPERCAFCDAETWCERRANGKRQCRACKVERFFSHVLYPPLGYELIGWQRKVLRDIYGTVYPETGLRRYRSAFIEVAKKNGKSFLVGGMPLYNLLMEEEPNPEAYGAAAAKDQAGLVFKSAALLVDANPDLKARLKVLPSTKRIVRRDGRGFYAVLAADGDVQDGIEPSLSIRDEVHRWKTARAETLRDVMQKGQISREQPLDVAITTAGAEYESPLWLEEYETAKRAMDSPSPNSNLYVAIFEPDLKRLNSDPEYWKSREARLAANPSHEELGGFLKDSAIVAEMNKALANPRARSKYFRYHLNVPVKALEDPVIDIQKWQECGGGVDLRTWPRYDMEKLIDEWGIAGQACWAGVDASWTTDLTSVSTVFPPFEGCEQWTLVPFFWMPAERVEHLERVCRVPFSLWIEQGFIEATPGNGIDMRSVKDRIRWLRDRFALREVPFDRTNFRTEAMNLKDEDGIETAEISQVFLELGYPTKFLLGAYLDRNIRHGNNPVLNWMAACLQLQYDKKDNCQPAKPERMRSAKRIDGIQATVTALNRALLAVPQTSGPIELW